MKRIPVAGGAGRCALVDDADAELVRGYQWYLITSNRSSYAVAITGRYPHRSYVYMHTLITGYTRTDHENTDGLDNRRANLRPATTAQNGANRRPNQGRRYKGAYRDNNRWRAQVKVAGKIRHLGSFATEEDAARAYDRAALAAWGEYARLNFPGH